MLDSILDWLIKCTMYFIPILLMMARYNSFLLHYKKPVIDVVVDGKFCIIPFCLALESIMSFFRKWPKISESIKLLGIIFFVGLLVIAIMLLLIYWDLSYVDVQNEGTITSKDKKSMMNIIIFASVAVLALSFCIDVVVA